MNVPAEIFRTYDIRGVVGRTLTATLVREVGRALGSVGRARGAPTFAVCRDGRVSGPELAEALMQGLAAAGANVVDIGMGPTPLAYFAAHHLGTGSCVAVSGSHNPPDYNGLKMVVGGDTLYGDEIKDLRRRILEGDVSSGSGKRSNADVLEAYVERIAGDVKLARPFHIAIDCGNGVAGMLAPRLFRRLGCEVTELFCEVDGRFPNHHPDPAQPENLQDLIRTLKNSKAELGFAFDGDGDRLGVVTKDGEAIFPDRQLMLFAKDVLSRNPGAEIIYDVKSTRLLAPWIERLGGKPTIWKTGHSLIKAKLKETGALLAGEGALVRLRRRALCRSTVAGSVGQRGRRKFDLEESSQPALHAGAALGAGRGRAARAGGEAAVDQALPGRRARTHHRRRARGVCRWLRACPRFQHHPGHRHPLRGRVRRRARAHQGRVPPRATAAQAQCASSLLAGC
ncbi:MAG: putative phosphoglucomutase [Burkholderiales bacterium]|nr:putative phosphoglucomutase [Burkholderiales bacterium]